MRILPLQPYLAPDPYGREIPEPATGTGPNQPSWIIEEFADRGTKHNRAELPRALLAAASADLATHRSWHQGRAEVRPSGMAYDDDRTLTLTLHRYEDWVSRESTRMRWGHGLTADVADAATRAHFETALDRPNHVLEDLHAADPAALLPTIDLILAAYWRAVGPEWGPEMPRRRQRD